MSPKENTKEFIDPKFFCIFADRCKIKSYNECRKCFEAFIIKIRINSNFGEHIIIFREGMKPLTNPDVDDTMISMFEKTTEEYLFPK